MTTTRALLATLNHDHAQRGMSAAFSSLVPHVDEFDYLAERRAGTGSHEINEHFFNRARALRPDWIWLQLQNTGVILAETIERIKRELPQCVISHWMGDCQEAVSDYSASICRAAHLTLLSNVGQIPLYLRAGAARVEYCQVAVDWHEDVLALPSWDPPFRVPDVVFCGNYYGSTFPGTGERASAIRSLWDAGIAVGVVGVGWPSDFPVVGRCGVKQQAHIYRKAKVALSINNFNSIELYYSDRQLIAMASGTPVVCKYVPGLEREFDNGSDCLWFRETPELIAHVKTLLENPEGRRRLGAAGRARIQRSHTWWHRILEVLPIVEHLRADS